MQEEKNSKRGYCRMGIPMENVSALVELRGMGIQWVTPGAVSGLPFSIASHPWVSLHTCNNLQTHLCHCLHSPFMPLCSRGSETTYNHENLAPPHELPVTAGWLLPLLDESSLPFSLACLPKGSFILFYLLIFNFLLC